MRAIHGRYLSAELAGVVAASRFIPALSREIPYNFNRTARFNVTGIIQFCAPEFSIFGAMHAAKTSSGYREEIRDDEAGAG
jgi:hypothetical protein